jgi:hypothetical protein
VIWRSELTQCRRGGQAIVRRQALGDVYPDGEGHDRNVT